MKTPKLLKIPIKRETNLREQKLTKKKNSVKPRKKKLKVQEKCPSVFPLLRLEFFDVIG